MLATLLTLALALPQLPPTISILPTSTITFTASPDHNTQFAGGPVLTGYTIEYFLRSQVSPAGVPSGSPAIGPVDLGKPTPNASNLITISTVFATINANIEYVAYVRAVGPGGSTRGNHTDPFGKPGAPGAATGAQIIR